MPRVNQLSATRFDAVPTQIELRPNFSGGAFAAAFARRAGAIADGQTDGLIRLSDRLSNQRASGSCIDLPDLEYLSAA